MPRTIVTIALLAALLAAAPATAEDIQHLKGSWRTVSTATVPPGLPPLDGLMTFTRTGEVLESRRLYLAFSPFGPILETGGHGAWVRTGEGEFELIFTFLVQAAPGNPTFTLGEPLGTDTIRMRLALDSSGLGFTGTFVSTARDNGGQVIFSAQGTVTGTRITVE